MDQIETFTGPEAPQVGASSCGQLRADSDQSFKSEYSVVEIAISAAILEAAVLIQLRVQKASD